MIVYLVVMDIVGNLVFCEVILLHNLRVGIVVRVDGFTFTFYRIDMRPGIIDSSSLGDTWNLVSGHK